MASKRRLRRKGCDGKMRHATAADAKAHIHSLHYNRGYSGRMNAYYCKFCKGYHCGHA